MYTKIIAYLLGRLSFGMGMAMVIPFIVAVFNDEPCF